MYQQTTITVVYHYLCLRIDLQSNPRVKNYMVFLVILYNKHYLIDIN